MGNATSLTIGQVYEIATKGRVISGFVWSACFNSLALIHSNSHEHVEIISIHPLKSMLVRARTCLSQIIYKQSDLATKCKTNLIIFQESCSQCRGNLEPGTRRIEYRAMSKSPHIIVYYASEMGIMDYWAEYNVFPFKHYRNSLQKSRRAIQTLTLREHSKDWPMKKRTTNRLASASPSSLSHLIHQHTFLQLSTPLNYSK